MMENSRPRCFRRNSPPSPGMIRGVELYPRPSLRQGRRRKLVVSPNHEMHAGEISESARGGRPAPAVSYCGARLAVAACLGCNAAFRRRAAPDIGRAGVARVCETTSTLPLSTGSSGMTRPFVVGLSGEVPRRRSAVNAPGIIRAHIGLRQHGTGYAAERQSKSPRKSCASIKILSS